MTMNAQESISPIYLFVVSFSIGQVIGVFGNALVIYCICRTRNLNINYYILALHLGTGDLLYLLFSLDTYLAWLPNSPFYRSLAMSKTWRPLSTLFFTAAVHFMVVISILRYRAVVHPFKRPVSKRKVRVIVCLVYVFALICVTPFVLVLRFTERCFEKWSNPSLNFSYTLFLSAVQYFIPITTLSMLYFKISHTLIQQNKTVNTMVSARAAVTGVGNEDQTHCQRRKRRRNVTTFITSVAIVVCLGVTEFPSQMLWLLYTSGLTEENEELLTWLLVVNWLGTSAVNPFIYGVFDKTLHSAYKRTWNKLRATFM